MPITKDALQRLRTHYNANKGTLPSQQKIADQSGLSESTVQRALTGQTENIKYETIARIAPVIGMGTEELGITDETVDALDNNDLQALVLALRDMNMRELAAQRKADDDRWRERLNSDQEKHQSKVELLNQEHSAEIVRIKDAHMEEIRRANIVHENHITQIQQMYARQMELMLDGHAKQIEAVQSIDRSQIESVQNMATIQKDADEKSKEFLKNRITQLDHRSKVKDYIIFGLLAVIFLLFLVDFMHPTMGWIRRVSSSLFSYRGPYA